MNGYRTRSMYAALSQSWYVIVMPAPPQPRAVVVAGLLWLSWCVFGGADFFVFFFFKQKTAYEILSGLVGSEMCIRDRHWEVRPSGHCDRGA